MNAREKVNNLLKNKKEKAKTEEQKEEVELIEHLLEYEDCFFRLDMETTVGILEYLGVKKNEINKVYKELTSPSEYMRIFPKQRYSINIQSK